MSNRFWKSIMKYTWVLVVLSLTVMVACTNIDTTPKEVAGGAIDEDQPVVIRTDDIFNQVKYKDKLTIRYFNLTGDVRMGDCILIITPDGKTMLIDAGVPDSGKQIVDYLDKLGIDTIDIALNTHPHYDHIGGIPSIVRTKQIKAFYQSEFPARSSGSYKNAMNAINSKKIPVTKVQRGDSFKLGNDVTVEILSPSTEELPSTIKDDDGETINRYSIVGKLIYKNHSYLFAGDIYKDREEELIALYGDKLKSDIVHAPHHGNETSSGNPYIDTVQPKIAIISNDKFSKFDIMKRYDRKEAKVVATLLHGNILIVADGDQQLDLITEKDWEGPPGLLNNQK